MHLRASLGTAILLGLKKGRMDAVPTTFYLMLGECCESNCLYCTQARDAVESDRLSRVIWPPFSFEEIIEAVRIYEAERKDGDAFPISRICVQTLHYKGMVDDLVELTISLKGATGVPVSASIPPLSRTDMERLSEAGMTWAGLAIDEASEELFDRVRPNLGQVGDHWRALSDALEVFDGAALHLIVGIGETDMELLAAASRALMLGADVALFAFTRLDERLPFTRPTMERYRAMQAAIQYFREGGAFEDLTFDPCGWLAGMPDLPDSQNTYCTSGCPGCNRPYYNESPGGPMYNIPWDPSEEEIVVARAAVMEYLDIIGRPDAEDCRDPDEPHEEPLGSRTLDPDPLMDFSDGDEK